MSHVTSQINIPSLLKIGDGKLKKIAKYLSDRKYMRVALFYSSGIEEIFGEVIQTSLDDFGIEVTHKNNIDDVNIENVIHTAFKIPKGTNVLLGIGGGKALDYSKYCAHVLSLPFISVPTSTSNDGFCSSNASLLVEGKRKSVKATMPYGVVVDIDAVKSSPENCIYSGIGDMVSKFSSLWDWKQAFLKGYEDLSDFAYITSQNSLMQMLATNTENVRDKEFLYSLANSLLMSGISMEICGSSRPASGSEHLISHALDRISVKPRMHGIQVGVATYLCTMLQNNQYEIVRNFLFQTGFVDFVKSNPLKKEELIEAVKLAPSIKEKYYTILSEPESVKNAIDLIENEEFLNLMIT